MTVDVLFFGCWGAPGHGFWLPGMEHAAMYETADLIPWGLKVDGRLTPTTTTSQGSALVTHKDGWTALAVHDYTGDHRRGSNSVFLFRDTLNFGAALARASVEFPALVARIGPIWPAGDTDNGGEG